MSIFDTVASLFKNKNTELQQKTSYIKIFGLQRSGTNAVCSFVEQSFNVNVLQNYLGNKHTPFDWKTLESALGEIEGFGLTKSELDEISKLVREKKLNFIINIKDPISWLGSYYKYQKKKTLYKNPEANFEFSETFARRVLKAWEANILSWLSFFQKNPELCILIQHEEVLSGLERKLVEIETKFGLNRKTESLVHYSDGYAKRGTDQQKADELINTKVKFDRTKHLDGRWLKEIPDEPLEIAIHFWIEFKRENPEYASLFNFEHYPEELKQKL